MWTSAATNTPEAENQEQSLLVCQPLAPHPSELSRGRVKRVRLQREVRKERNSVPPNRKSRLQAGMSIKAGRRAARKKTLT